MRPSPTLLCRARRCSPLLGLLGLLAACADGKPAGSGGDGAADGGDAGADGADGADGVDGTDGADGADGGDDGDSGDTGGEDLGETFREPPELEMDADGVYQLRFAPSEVELGGARYCLRAYNGSVPGPTIRVPAGADRKIRVDLENAFIRPDERLISGQEGFETEHCYDFNLTNLHFHGGHVRPEYAVGGPACAGEGCGRNPADGDSLADDFYGDNVLIEVPYLSRAKYRWDIDEDHLAYAGTNWYHPHIHGSTGIQLANGAAGTIIIEGDLDTLPVVSAAKERLLVVNHMPWDVTATNVEGLPLVEPLADGEACSEDTLSINNFLAITKASRTLLNGQVAPTLVSPPGQVERWRFVHAGGTDEMYMALFPSRDATCGSYDNAAPQPLVQIAADGITLTQSFTRQSLFFSPGYRMEVLVALPPTEQTWCLIAARPTDLTVPDGGLPVFPDVGNVLAVIQTKEAAGAPSLDALPPAAELDALLASIAPPTAWTDTVRGVPGVTVSCDNLEDPALAESPQEVVLLHPGVDPGVSRETASTGGSCRGESGDHGHGATDPCLCPEPNVNCRNFGPRHAFVNDDGAGYRNDRVLRAGESDHWEVLAADGHPYHIHINPYVVCPSASTKEPPFPHWRDTLWVQLDDIVANGMEPVHLLAKYPEIYAGRYVFHCHKLNHEDEGMMELVEACAPGDADCLCLDGEVDAEGACVESNAGCYPDDLACNYAKYVMAGFSPDDLTSPPALPRDADAAARNDLAEGGLQECCQEVPSFEDERDLVTFVGGLLGLDPRCCPAFSLPLPPGHPCEGA